MMTPDYTTFVKGIIPGGSEKRSKMTNSQTKLPRSKQRRSCPLPRAAGSSKNSLRSVTLFPNRLSFLQLVVLPRATFCFLLFSSFRFRYKKPPEWNSRGLFERIFKLFAFPVRKQL